MVFAVRLVQRRAGTSDIRDFRSLLATGLRYLVPMALGIAAEALVSKAILLIARLPDSGRAATLINWTEQPFRKAVKELIRYTLIYDVIYALIYLPIAMLVGSAVLLLGYAVSDIRRYRRAHVLLVYLGLFLSLGLLALIQGAPSPRRVQFVYPYFVAFTGLLVTQTACRSRSGWKRRSLVALMALLVFYQAEDISHWFALDYQRFDNERAAVREIGYDLRAEKGYGKPVVFCGGYYFAGLYDDYVRGATSDNPLALSLTNAVNYYFEKESQQRLKIQESSDILYIPWSYFAWGDFSDLIKFFKRYGFDITVTLDPEIRKAADQMAADMPTFPVEGYIRDAGDYLVVHLGE